MIGIGAHLDHDARQAVLREALDAAQGLGDEVARASILAAQDRVEEALAVARGIGDEWARARALEALAPRLAEAGRVEEALAVARGIGDEVARARALAALGRVDEALATAIPRDGGSRLAWNFSLADLAPRLAAAGRVDEALAMARRILDHSLRARAWRTWVGWMRRWRRCGGTCYRIVGPDPGGAGAPPGGGRPGGGGAGDGAGDRGQAGPRLRLAALGRLDEALATARGIGDERACTCAWRRWVASRRRWRRCA